MKPVIVRNVRIGEGLPKICAPIVGRTREEIVAAAKELSEHPVDVAEWRADWYLDSDSPGQIVRTAEMLREALGEMPLLFTFRTIQEGGEKNISKEDYKNMNRTVAVSGFVDLVDVEAFMDEALAKEMIDSIHQAGVKVVASNHDFHKTPEKDEIIRRLLHMRNMGADLPKIAVMPRNKADVLTLLSATLEMSEKYGDCPIITMSMGKDGMVSRISGGIFGSALTFGAVEQASAPGQMAVEELEQVLQILHRIE